MKKMKNGVFLGIWTPVLAVVLIIGIALNLMATTFSTQLIRFLSWQRGTVEVIKAEGTENWDTDYYSYEASSLAEATANADKAVEEISNEGFVLLKNKNNTLPLSTQNDTLALLGRGAVDPIYGGSGSGNTSGASTLIDPLTAFTEEGFNVDMNAYGFFNNLKGDYARANIVMDNPDASSFFIGEIPQPYSFTPVSTQTAVIFIARGGGEGWDLSTNLKASATTKGSADALKASPKTQTEVDNYSDTQHQLELSKEEKDMIKFAKSNYAKTVVVLNSSNAMELGEIAAESGELAVDAILSVGSPGGAGFRAMANIFSGATNPSGRLVDIYTADFTQDPTFKNNGIYQYTGLSADDVAKGTTSNNAYTMQYEEGIYLGYKYYETAHVEALKGNYAGFNYDEQVVYPFGYGLSYSTFTQRISAFDAGGDDIQVTVEVSNVSGPAGKCAVQLYYTPPYTPGGIEKAAVNLIQVGKVDVAAGGKQTISFTIPKEELASYDYKKSKMTNGGYILESGDYEITLRSDSHTVLDTKTFNVNNDIKYDNGRASDVETAQNRFDDVSTMFKDNAQAGYARNFSRSDFAGTFPTTPTADDLNSSISVAAQQNGGTTVKAGLAKFNVETDPTLGNVATSKVYSDTAPVMNAGSGASLIDLRGKDYDDYAWDGLLDGLQASDYSDSTFNASAYNTAQLDSIGKPLTADPDGPAGISSLFGRTGCAAYMSEVVLGCTFNPEMGEKMGKALGEEAYYYNKKADSKTGGTSGWYAPAMNIHRSPFSGRNFEYYSEDGVLGGLMGAAVVRGASSKGVYCYIKHFALNDTEIWRTNNLCIWANEQAIRETYLKPFEMTVKNSVIELKYIADAEGNMATKTMNGCLALMSSFNRLGTTWAGGHYGLMTEVLRNEWGFRGVVISDFNLYEYMPSDQGMRAGTDLQLNMQWGPVLTTAFADKTSNTALTAMRKSIHNMSYAVVHSNIMQGAAPGSTFIYHLAGWQVAFITLAVIAYVAVAAGVAWVVLRMIKVKKSNASQQN